MEESLRGHSRLLNCTQLGCPARTKVFLGGWVAPETTLYLTAGSWQKPLFNMAAANKTLIEGPHARNSKHDVRTDDPKT